MLPEELDGWLLYYSSLPAYALKKPIKLMRAALPCVFPSFFKTLLTYTWLAQ